MPSPIPHFSRPDCGVKQTVANRNFHVHLVSDSTGETVSSVARACLVQYEGIFVQEHVWSLVRTRGQMEKVVQAVERDRGPVLYTLVDQELRDLVRDHCRRLQLPCVGVLDQAMSVLAVHFHSKSEQWPGRQHQLDEGYFDRIDAMHFTLAHDDGQSTHDLEDAEPLQVRNASVVVESRIAVPAKKQQCPVINNYGPITGQTGALNRHRRAAWRTRVSQMHRHIDVNLVSRRNDDVVAGIVGTRNQGSKRYRLPPESVCVR